MAHNLARLLRNLRMDLRYGGKFLGGTTQTKFSEQGAHDTANTDYSAMPYLFGSTIKEDDVVTDIGSGKGRVINYLLDKFPRTKIYGLELDPDCADTLRQRLQPYTNVTILCGDACEKIPQDTTVLYLFNPFDRNVMARFKASVSKLAEAQQRPIRIIYYNPTCLDVFSNDPRFTVDQLQLPPNFHRAVLITAITTAPAHKLSD